MKILILNWRDMKHPQAGGSELYFNELAKEWVKRGHQVTWIAGGWKSCKKKETIDGIRIIRAGKNRATLYLFSPLEYLKLDEKPDIIIDVENGIPYFSPFFSRAKKVLHIHHIHKDVWAKEFNPPLSWIGQFLEAQIMPRVYKRCGITTISESSKKDILNGYGADAYIINPGIQFYKRKNVKKTKEPTLLFLNRIKKYKGLEILLQAVKLLKEKGISNFKLSVVGRGDDLVRMQQYVKKHNLSNVEFLGHVSEKKKEELMQRSWIFVNPSFKEGWGIVNIEANYLGTPVIGSNVGGIKDSVKDNETGFLFEYGNAEELSKKIELLFNNPKLREEMGRKGEKWAKNFSWRGAADKFLEILEKKK